MSLHQFPRARLPSQRESPALCQVPVEIPDSRRRKKFCPVHRKHAATPPVRQSSRQIRSAETPESVADRSHSDGQKNSARPVTHYAKTETRSHERNSSPTSSPHS